MPQAPQRVPINLLELEDVLTSRPSLGSKHLYAPSDKESLTENARRIFTNYILTSVGAFVGGPVGLAKAAGQSGINILQNLLPEIPRGELPVSDPEYNPRLVQRQRFGGQLPGATEQQATTPGGRADRITNAVSMGLFDSFRQNFAEERARRGPVDVGDGFISNPGVFLEDNLTAAAKTAIMDVLPGGVIRETFSGERPTRVDEGGRVLSTEPIDAWDVGVNLFTGAVQVAPLLGGLGRAQARLGVKGTFERPAALEARTLSKGEINAFFKTPEGSDFARTAKGKAAAETLGIDLAKIDLTEAPNLEGAKRDLGGADPINLRKSAHPEGAAPGPILNSKGEPITLLGELPEDIKRHFTVERPLLATPDLLDIQKEVMMSATFDKIMSMNPNRRWHDWVLAAVDEGVLSGETVTRMSQKYGLPMEEVTKVLIKVIDDTNKQYGEGLGGEGRLALMKEASIAMRAIEGDAEAAAIFKKMRDRQFAIEPNPLDSWGAGGRWIRDVSNHVVDRLRRSLMLVPGLTALRNLFNAGANVGITQLFEDSVTSIFSSMQGGKIDTTASRIAHSDALTDLFVLRHKLNPRNWKATKLFSPEQATALWAEIPRVYPMTHSHLMQGSAYEIGSQFHWNLLKGAAKREGTGFLQAIDWAANNLPVANNLQEAFMRKSFFQARTLQNLRTIGLDKWLDDSGVPYGARNTDLLKGALHEGMKDNLHPDIKWALADSTIHSLKNTFAYRSENSITRMIDNVYRVIPFSHSIFPTFPRFLASSWQYVFERSPGYWLDLLSEPHRSALMGHINDGIKTKQAQRELSKAMSGTALLAGAYMLRTSPFAGPKYYQLYMNDTEDGQPILRDLRSYGPFSSVYMGAAEFMLAAKEKRPANLTASERMDLLANLRSVQDTPALGVFDVMREMSSENPEVSDRVWQRFLGRWGASWLAPFSMVKDMVTILEGPKGPNSEQPNYYGREGTGPMISRLPTQLSPFTPLPARVDPFTGEPMRNDKPVFRQLTGITSDIVTPLKKLTMELGVDVNRLIGDYASADANAAVAREFHAQLQTKEGDGPTKQDRLFGAITKARGVVRDDILKMILNKQLGEMRDNARETAEEKYPQLFLKDKIQNESLPQNLKTKQLEFLQRLGTPNQ